jgi:hypothetical protein
VTLDELFQACPNAEAVYEEAGAFRVVNIKTGARCRTFSAERANDKSLYKEDPEFCAYQLWHGVPGERGEVGLKVQIQKNVPLEFQESALHYVRSVMPGCQHTDGDEYRHVDDDTVCVRWDDDCERSHICVPKVSCEPNFPTPSPAPGHIEISCSEYLKLTPEEKVGKSFSLKRDSGPVGVGGLIEQLRDAAARAAAKEAGLPAPTPTVEWLDGTKTRRVDGAQPIPNDANEPIFIVTDNAAALQIYRDMQIRDRLQQGLITRWYAHNCLYVMDARARKAILGLKSPEDVTGPLSWKPVVLTLRDPDIEERLQRCCKQVVTVEQGKDGTWSLDKVHDAVKLLIAEKKVSINDMPEDVLDGWLGRLCKERMGAFPIAFAWPALLSAASVLVPHSSNPSNRTNVFAALIGGKGTGKTSAFDYAIKLLDIKSPPLMKLKAGSGEGLTKEIGDVGGSSRLYFTDELAHLLLKMQIQGSAFATILNTIFYEDQQDLVLARNARVNFNCRLSVAGGVVDEMFNDLFGAATTGGFYDRFIFGVAPSGYGYKYREFTGEPALRTPDPGEPEDAFGTDRPVPVDIDRDVWDARDRIAEELKLTAADNRLLELGLRAALIAASLDGRRTLHGADLGPMKAFVAYQMNVRKRFKPNPGKNSEAIVACKVTDYLADHQGDGDGWISQRDMFRSTHVVIDWGPSIVNRALNSLEICGDIELGKNGRVKVVRKVKR